MDSKLLPQFKKFLIWTGLVVAIVISFSIYLDVLKQKMGYTGVTRYTASMEPVDVMLDGKIHLRIPKAYLTEKNNWQGADQENVTIRAVLPDMKPLMLSQNYSEDDVVELILYFAVNKNLQNSNDFERYNSLRNYLSTTNFGLDKLSPKIFAEERGQPILTGLDSYSEYYFNIHPKRGLITIKCDKTGPKCQVRSIFRKKIFGSYLLSNKKVPEAWQETDLEVNSLVESFFFEGQQKGERP